MRTCAVLFLYLSAMALILGSSSREGSSDLALETAMARVSSIGAALIKAAGAATPIPPASEGSPPVPS